MKAIGLLIWSLDMKTVRYTAKRAFESICLRRRCPNLITIIRRGRPPCRELIVRCLNHYVNSRLIQSTGLDGPPLQPNRIEARADETSIAFDRHHLDNQVRRRS